MADQIQSALKYARSNSGKFLDSFKEILSIPSVSTDPAHALDIRKAADWLAAQLRGLGMQKVQIFPTAKHPIVYGEWLGRAGAPVVLIYGHYDVQPADPLDLWKSLRLTRKSAARISMPAVPLI